MSTNAATLKEEGNALLLKGKAVEAHAKYTEAIGIANAEQLAVLYCNRAQACMFLKRWEDARHDAADALVADATYYKAWLRLGQAYTSAEDFVSAMRAYELGMELAKEDAPLMRAFDQAVRVARTAASNTVGTVMRPPPVDTSRPLQAVRLNNEGAPFITASDWLNAYLKFTLALVFDRSSATIYYNLANTAVQRKQWERAIADVAMAIELNPEHVNARVCLGVATLNLKRYSQSQAALQKAVNLLDQKPKPLSPADEELRTTVLSTKARADAGLREEAGMPSGPPDAPWILAAQSLAATPCDPNVQSTYYTSALLIDAAYKSFSGGVTLLYQAQFQSIADLFSGGLEKLFQSLAKSAPNGGSSLTNMGPLQHIVEKITTGLLYDMRVFHVTHADLKQRMEQAIDLESMVYRAFKETDSRALLEAVKARLRTTNGWVARDMNPQCTRNAVSITVFSMILKAAIAWKFDQEYERACSLFHAVYQFLRLGRREWADVPRNLRGPVFDRTFPLLVGRAYLECLRERYTTHGRVEAPGSPDLLIIIEDLADTILPEVHDLPREESTVTHENAIKCLATVVYPGAVAYDALALCYLSKADEASSSTLRREILAERAEWLRRSTSLYPTDEPRICEATYQLLDCMFKLDEPLARTIPQCNALARSYMRSEDIWRGTPVLKSGDSRWAPFLVWGIRVKEAGERGEVDLQDVITPDNIDVLLQAAH